ncbi:MAG: copper transporter [Firmicutes bacterium]|nr:copper transporter [Bacillota bacterium]
MLDMRYHVASLIAVFLALAIGILLGTVIVDKGVISNQQSALVKRIEANFTALRDENRSLKAELYQKREFENKSFPVVVQNKLSDTKVIIISTGTLSDGSLISNIADDLKKAGAATNTVWVQGDFKINDDALATLQPYFQDQLSKNNAREEILKKMVADIVKGAEDSATAANETGSSYLQQLKDLRYIKSDIDFNAQVAPVSKFVIVGGSETNEDPKNTDLPIISELKALGVRVVGVESTTCKKSYMPFYQATEIPTVDNVDQRIGVISMIYALAGADGNYGLKKTAAQLMPNLITP